MVTAQHPVAQEPPDELGVVREPTGGQHHRRRGGFLAAGSHAADADRRRRATTPRRGCRVRPRRRSRRHSASSVAISASPAPTGGMAARGTGSLPANSTAPNSRPMVPSHSRTAGASSQKARARPGLNLPAVEGHVVVEHRVPASRRSPRRVASVFPPPAGSRRRVGSSRPSAVATRAPGRGTRAPAVAAAASPAAPLPTTMTSKSKRGRASGRGRPPGRGRRASAARTSRSSASAPRDRACRHRSPGCG